MDANDKKIATIEQQLQQIIKQNKELNQRVQFLERENARRRSEVNQIASAVNRKG